MATQETTIPRRPVVREGVAFDRAEAERAALQAVLKSRAFESKPRLAALLDYICDRYFEGSTDAIKEYSIATDVFRRPASFDQATDSIVRVEVFRLRRKLREFYSGEGAEQPLEIVIATGHYRPEFVDRCPSGPAVALGEEPAESDLPSSLDEDAVVGELAEGHSDGLQGAARVHTRRWFVIGGVIVLFAASAIALAWWWQHGHATVQQTALEAAATPAAALPVGPEVRIRCGYSRSMYKDEAGNIWTGDRYFSGGFVTELPNQPIARTRNPGLYLTARSGVFSYSIPLPRGVYELHLHFAETTYSPASTLGGGENSRVFDVRMNGRPLLTQFDIVNDAGANTADVRVFRDVSPASDGFLHLDFNGSLGLPMINAIELLPGIPHQIRPIRMVAQNSFFVDKAGNLWMPDTYFASGRLASDKLVVSGTAEPGLFAGERYGNFSYALPADSGTYRLTLYFSEKYWGGVSGQGGAGSRVFDVLCNGIALARREDIYREAGAGHALVKVFQGLHPNAQGKLIVSFVPDVNYASVDAVKLEQEDVSR